MSKVTTSNRVWCPAWCDDGHRYTNHAYTTGVMLHNWSTLLQFPVTTLPTKQYSATNAHNQKHDTDGSNCLKHGLNPSSKVHSKKGRNCCPNVWHVAKYEAFKWAQAAAAAAILSEDASVRKKATPLCLMVVVGGQPCNFLHAATQNRM